VEYITESSPRRKGGRLPPFAKALQARGPGLVLVVPSSIAGMRCARLHDPGDVLLLQLGHDPGLYHWPVQDCNEALNTESLDATTARRTVDVLMRSGAAAVHCCEYRARAAA